MSIRKHVLPYLMALVLALPVIAILSISANQRNAIRKEFKHRMIEGIDREELVLLKFKKSEVDDLVRWEHSKEFEYQNSMYDIVETEEDGEMIFFWCWWDHKETALNRKLYAHLSAYLSSNREEQHKKNMVVQFFRNLFNDYSKASEFAQSSHDLKFPPFLISYTPAELPSQSPPPKRG